MLRGWIESEGIFKGVVEKVSITVPSMNVEGAGPASADWLSLEPTSGAGRERHCRRKAALSIAQS